MTLDAALKFSKLTIILPLMLATVCAFAKVSDARPTAPASVRADVIQDTAVLTWKAVDSAKRYRVYRSANGGRFSKVAEVTDARFEAPLSKNPCQSFAISSVSAIGGEGPRSQAVSAIRLVRPWGIAVGPDGTRYIRDAACAQAISQSADGAAASLSRDGSVGQEGSFDVAVSRDGQILTAVRESGREERSGFRISDGRGRVFVDHCVSEGTEEGHFRKPMGIAVDSRGHVFVADSGNDRVQEFSQDGRFVQTIGSGELFQPMKIAFDGRERLFVADSTKNRIAIFERQTDGAYKLAGALSGKIKEPCYVAIDDQDRVFVSTNRIAGIYAYDKSGALIWEYHGEPDRPLSGPRGLAFDGKGNLLVVDDALRRIWTVKLPN